MGIGLKCITPMLAAGAAAVAIGAAPIATAAPAPALPATVAAGRRGDSMVPSGMTMVIGFKQPAFIGMSSSTSVRKT